MELPRSTIGRRPSATDPFIPSNEHPSSSVQQNGHSSAVSASPALGDYNHLGAQTTSSSSKYVMNNNRRMDDTPSPFLDRPPSSGIYFGSSPSTGPSNSSSAYRAPLFTSANGHARTATSSRPFYRDERPSLPILIRDVILRPIYLLSRRGPLLPIVLLLALFLLFLTYSTSPSSQSVKLRMQGAVGPYIPVRAANAINWSNSERLGADPSSEFEDDESMIDASPKSASSSTSNKGISPNKRKGRKGRLPKAKGVSSAQLMELPEPRMDGRLLLKEGELHPIPALIQRAKKQWKDLKRRQSKSFKSAVAEYKRRYGRNPPRGFDKWYAFAKAHKVLLIDEFDLIDKDLLMYRAFRPAQLRARVAHIPKFLDFLWEIEIKDGQVVRGGDLANHDRAKGVEYLISRFAGELPDMKIVYNGHDGARIAVTAEERERLEGLALKGEYDADAVDPFWPKELGPDPHHSMPVFCPNGSAVREPGFDYGWASMEATGHEMPEPIPETIGTFVDDFHSYIDVCNSPQYRHFHCTTSWVYSHHPTPVAPLFTPGVQTTFGDVHALIVEQLELESKNDPAWEERPFTSLQWRGQTSGPLWEKNTPWRSTQRARLHLLSHQEEGYRNITLTDEDDKMRVEEVPNYRLNPLFLDVGMVGPAVQCVQEDGTCDEMYKVFQGYDKRISFDRASLYKYVLDVDGNSWSGRFRRLMLSNAAVIKATIFPEFWTDWAIPWIHFIPMQVDYSDMWDLLAFFRGGINGEGAHDLLGKQIAEAGKDWVKSCYRWADLEAYQFRLMLEYARLYNDDGGDFEGDTTYEPVWTGDVRLK